jgi:voltage-gated potassium channel
MFVEAITMIFTGITITFLKQLCFGLWLTLPLLLSLASGITLLGYGVKRKEGWSHMDTFYWSFVTATTVGYGDLRPAKNASKIAAVLIAFMGLMMSGIIVAVTVHAVNLALDMRR